MSPFGHPGRALRRPAALPALLLSALPAAAGLVVMHGTAEPTGTVHWIQGAAPGPVSVRWRPEGEAADLRFPRARQDEP